MKSYLRVPRSSHAAKRGRVLGSPGTYRTAAHFPEGPLAQVALGPPRTRAPRFPLHLPLRYRAVGEGSWREGLTENISGSGVLFRAQDLLQVSTPVELTFRLSVADLNSEVFCRGQVVRTVPPAGPSGPPALAATIADYHFQRRGA